MSDCGTFYIYVGANDVYNNTDQEKATAEFWKLSGRYSNKPVILVKTQVLATNSVAQAAIQQQRKV